MVRPKGPLAVVGDEGAERERAPLLAHRRACERPREHAGRGAGETWASIAIEIERSLQGHVRRLEPFMERGPERGAGSNRLSDLRQADQSVTFTSEVRIEGYLASAISVEDRAARAPRRFGCDPQQTWVRLALAGNHQGSSEHAGRRPRPPERARPARSIARSGGTELRGSPRALAIGRAVDRRRESTLTSRTWRGDPPWRARRGSQFGRAPMESLV